DIPIEEWDRVMAVNVRGVFLGMKAAAPAMRKAGGGSIINVSSTAGIRWMGVPYASYAATKAALLGLSRNIAAQYAPDNIRCNVILPGIIDTPLLRNLLAEVYEGEDMEARIAYRNKQIPMQRMGDAWDVAHAALYLASDEAKYITGAEIPVDGGVSIAALAG
ncbi:MAG: SDR family oxidoreductase, partial [Alphaproteobacteria bacterium]|nr:SDR family oxidoreductase [Alphaproteobacteria bacterium]